MGEDSLWLLVPTAQRRDGGWIDDVLRPRVLEKGLGDRLSEVGEFPRRRVEVLRGPHPARDAAEHYYRRGWTDGLPVVAPTIGRVEAMVRGGARDARDVVGELEPLKGLATVERIAANAVMAGCTPDLFPFVLAAVDGIAAPEFNLNGVQTTDENVAPLLMVSGPGARAAGFNDGFGALGPGWRANAAVGRALRLVMHNIGGGWPAAVSFAGLAQPARYTLCLAEAAELSPWEPLGVELGFDEEATIAVVQRAETCINVTGGLVDIASVMGSAASLFTMLYNGIVAVVLAPFVASELAARGWSKRDVKRRLFETGRMPAEAWRRSWLVERLIAAERWPEWVHKAAETGSIPAVAGPEDITVIVAGGDVPIPQCAYLPSWGFPPCRVAREIEI